MTNILLLILFFVGFFAVITRRNLFKIVIGFMVMRFALYLFFIIASNSHAADGAEFFAFGRDFVHTLVAVELAISIFGAGLIINIFHKYGTLDISKIRKLKG